MKRCEFFVIYNTDTGKTALKVKGYMFQKYGHWFTVRRRIPSENHKKWIISDFVTGVIMTDTDNKIEDIPSVISETMVSCMLEIYLNRSVREELRQYADMIHAAMFKDNPKSKMLELHQSQAEELFN